jgi:tetratricopeptide (TPR) repeat protein
MTAHLTRGTLLLQQSRHQQAADEFRQHLLQEPNDPVGHAHLALSLAELKQFAPATEHARQAIGLAPDIGFGHFVLANVMIKRNRLQEAKAAIDEAISLDPYVPMYFFLRGLIHGDQHRWEDALADADAGLEIDPEDAECLNLRAQSLMKLGRRLEAGESLEEALQRDPDNAFTHTTRGWSLLEQRQTKEALSHFREALRLDPDFEWARAGIVEALKARHFVYRIFLGYIFWMSRMSPQARWGIVIGGYLGYHFLASFAAANPAVGIWVLPLLIVYIAFALLTWLAGPLFNLLLRTSRYGRLALSSDQTWGANLFGLMLAAAIGLLGAGLWSGNIRLLVAALYTGLLMLPASSIFVCSAGWPRWTMGGVTLLLAMVGVAELTSLAVVDGRLMETPTSRSLGNLFIYGILGSQLLANGVVGARVKD